MRLSMMTALALTLLTLPPATARAEAGFARALIERSIAYHDPAGIWWSSARTVALLQPREEGAEQRTTFVLFADADQFRLRVTEGAAAVTGRIEGDSCSISFAGDDLEASRKRFETMNCERMRLYRSYYGYLFSAPMNLLDAGGAIEPEVIETTFMERPVHAVRIRYGADQPVWDHYFDPSTAALVGCRFARDPEWKTGEYIAFKGEALSNGVRLPRERAWYYNENDKYLATDIIESFTVAAPQGAGD